VIGVVDDTPLPPLCIDTGVFGGVGDDTITGGSGDDCLDGWIGDDTVSGNAGNDVVLGFNGDDTLTGGADGDSVFGEADDDAIDEGEAPSGSDFLRGNTGVDELNYGARTTSTIINMTTGVCGADANADGDAGDTGDENDNCDGDFEVLVTGSANDSLTGDGSDETFLGQGGNDVVDGNGGFNTNSWSTSAGPITVDSAAGTATGDGDDSWTDIDELDGSPATNDLLDFSGETGPVTANLCISAFTGTSSFTEVTVANAGLVNCTATFEHLTGSPGNDNLTGDAQQNKLIGGLGSDAFTGLGGADTVSFKNAENGVEVDLSLGFAEGEGSDSFPGGLGDIEIIVGSNFDDTITGGLTTGGGSINFRFKGLKGDDSLTGSASNDTLLGGGGSDVMRSGQGDDTLKDAAGNDLLAGGGGFDIGKGGKGNDVCSGIESTSSCGTKKHLQSPQVAARRQI
jgi:Ca2+-binding RTX toxin-like protein